MKKLAFLSWLCLIVISASAQFKIDLIMSSTPPGNLTEWVNRREVLTLLVTGQAGIPPQNLKIKTEIKTTDGTVIGNTDLARASSFAFAGSAPTILTATEVMPMENMVFTGKYKSSLQRTGKLPADNYILCVQLVRPVDFAPASEVKCKSFYLAATQLPVLMKPYNEEVLDAKLAQTAITFRWSPVSPRTTAQITYRIQVFEVLPNQTPMQALRANQPLLDQELTGATQYIWRPQLTFMAYFTADNTQGSMPDNPHHNKIVSTGTDTVHIPRFIWTLQTLDDHGLPITQTDGNGEARSEPVVFYVKDKVQKQ
jgi:hypothetical protein